MSALKIVGTLIVGLLLAFVVRITLLLTPIWAKILASPWWVYAIVVGIFVSGYLSFKYTKDKKEIERAWIEEEGETFMEPIRKKRRDKQIVNE